MAKLLSLLMQNDDYKLLLATQSLSLDLLDDSIYNLLFASSMSL